MITAEDTAHRTPAGLANLRISSQTVRRRLREYGLRARYPVVGPIIDQHHRIVRLAWAYARRRWRLHAVVGGFTWQHILLVMNPDIHFISAMEDIICTAGVGNVLRTSVCTNPPILEVEVLWSGLEYVMMVALSSKLFKNTMKQRNCDHIFQHGNVGCHVARVCQDFLTQNHIRVLPWPAL